MIEMVFVSACVAVGVASGPWSPLRPGGEPVLFVSVAVLAALVLTGQGF